jgi:hypothetical protein
MGTILQALQIICAVDFDELVLKRGFAKHVKNVPFLCKVEQRLVAQSQLRQVAGCAERHEAKSADGLQVLKNNGEDYRISVCDPAAWPEDVVEDRTQTEYTLRDVNGLGANRSTNLDFEAIGGCSGFLLVLSSTVLCAKHTLSYREEALRALVEYL